MDKPNISGGLWNCARPSGSTYSRSQQTQELLQLLMEDSHLANAQKRQIRECLKNGAPLHLTCALNSPPPPAPPPQSNPNRSTSRRLPSKPQKRSADQCKAGNSYVREKFRPGPTRDLEKEKRRLQKILEMGKDEPKVTIKQSLPNSEEAPEEKDRIDEILEEIQERRQFLDDMASLGQEQQYVYIMNAEISQRIRELELNKSSSQINEEGSSEKVDGTEK